jgi:phenylalanyl-tRNA synthetase beta chain
LTHLGFGVTVGGTGRLLVRVPSWRLDVNCQEDLIEEVTRIFGYEHIPTTLPAVLPQVAVASYRALVCKTKELLVGLGLQEVITYSLVSKNDAQDFPLGVGLVPLAVANPLSQDQETLRALLMPSLVRCAAYNVNQKQGPLALFEIADTYTRSDSSGAGEELRLGIVLCGQRSMFLTNGIVRDELGLLHLKGIVETVLARLGIEGVSFRPLGGAVVELAIGTEPVGAIVDVPGHLLGRFDIKNKKAVAAEIYLERVFAHIKGAKKFVPLPASPGITRDISLVLPESISVQSVIAAIRQEAGSLLRDVSLADYYRGKQIPEGKRGLTLSCFYQALKRTLTEEEVAPVHSRVCAVVVEKFQAAIR